jgi:hypothetical protein
LRNSTGTVIWPFCPMFRTSMCFAKTILVLSPHPECFKFHRFKGPQRSMPRQFDERSTSANMGESCWEIV